MAQIGCTPCGVSVGPRFERPKCESGAQSGANCPACTNGGDLPGKVSQNCTIRRAKWGSAARVVQIGCTPCGVSAGPQFGRPNCESGAQSGADCPACTNGGDLPGKVSENCTIRRAKWGSAARVVQIGCTPCGVSAGPQFERPDCESGARSGAELPSLYEWRRFAWESV